MAQEVKITVKLKTDKKFTPQLLGTMMDAGSNTLARVGKMIRNPKEFDIDEDHRMKVFKDIIQSGSFYVGINEDKIFVQGDGETENTRKPG